MQLQQISAPGDRQLLAHTRVRSAGVSRHVLTLEGIFLLPGPAGALCQLCPGKRSCRSSQPSVSMFLVWNESDEHALSAAKTSNSLSLQL